MESVLPFDYHQDSQVIPFTKPFLPPIATYYALVQEIWNREWVTNNGPLLQQLEKHLAEELRLQHLLVVNNGTVAIQLAIRALQLTGEIITTPFSYVATTSSIVWEHCTPVFVDIKETDYNIDENLIEDAITPRTSAILATHVFGNPCNVQAIQKIADRHNLRVIYDGAHAFGTTIANKSIFDFGDITTCSLHATKIYHAIEGGLVVTGSNNLHESIKLLRNFGHNGPDTFSGVGINGKNSEFHAAMGLINLRYWPALLKKRKEQFDYYKDALKDIKYVSMPEPMRNASVNRAYFPVVFRSEKTALEVFIKLAELKISSRRYFYPALNLLDYVQSNPMPIAERVASSILCLPMFHTMPQKVAEDVIAVVKKYGETA